METTMSPFWSQSFPIQQNWLIIFLSSLPKNKQICNTPRELTIYVMIEPVALKWLLKMVLRQNVKTLTPTSQVQNQQYLHSRINILGLIEEERIKSGRASWHPSTLRAGWWVAVLYSVIKIKAVVKGDPGLNILVTEMMLFEDKFHHQTLV